MTGPTLRHWLTGFVFAALAHLILAAFVMGFWREAPQEAGPAERAGLEITLFPGFNQAVQQVSPDAPPGPEIEPPPVDAALESAPPMPLLPPDRQADEGLAVMAELVATPESAMPVAAEPAVRQPPTDVQSGFETVSRAEVVEAAPAPEVSALAVPTAPVPPEIPDASEIPAARLDLATEPAPAVDPFPLAPIEEPLEPVVVAESEAPIGARPLEPLVATVPTAAEVPIAVPPDTASVADLAPVVTKEDPPAAVAMAEPADEAPTAPTFVVPDPVETVTVAPATTSPEPVSATEAPEMAPLAVTESPETADAIDVGTIVTAAEAAPAEAIVMEDAQVTELRPEPADPVSIAEAIEVMETTALPPETEADARETPLPSAAAEPSGPEQEEDSGAQDPPSPEIAQDAPQSPGIQEQYYRLLRDWLDRHKDYPRLAQRRGEEGTVMLAFTLNRYGMVLGHAIVRSSGHTMLDNTVEHLIRRAQPLPAIPPEMNLDTLQVIVPIEFRLER
jgi:periplasmic protein TonB